MKKKTQNKAAEKQRKMSLDANPTALMSFEEGMARIIELVEAKPGVEGHIRLACIFVLLLSHEDIVTRSEASRLYLALGLPDGDVAEVKATIEELRRERASQAPL